MLQGRPTVAPYAPLTTGPNSPLSQRDGPAKIPQELVAENGLFQPKLILAPKFPKLTPRPDPLEIGTRQLTLCPSCTNSLEPSPNLVSSEVPASGQHGFVKWGHDAKIIKIGLIPTRGPPGPGKANGSQGRRRDLRLNLSVQIGFGSRLPVGLEEWCRQLTTRKGVIGVPKWRHFGCLK